MSLVRRKKVWIRIFVFEDALCDDDREYVALEERVKVSSLF